MFASAVRSARRALPRVAKPAAAQSRKFMSAAIQYPAVSAKVFGGVAVGLTAWGFYGWSTASAASVATPQTTVITPVYPNSAMVTIYLNKSWLTRTASPAEVAAAAARLPEIVKEVVGDTEGEDGRPAVVAGIGFSNDYWKDVCNQLGWALPPVHREHKTRSGKYGSMPSAGTDLFLHVKAETQSLAFEVAKAFVDSLPAGAVTRVDDRYGWVYQDGRDLSGFLDGTENPAQQRERSAAALNENFGSYAVHQRWLHDTKTFHNKPVAHQEAAVGRTKPDSAELTGEDLTITSHVARMRDEAGRRIPIVRQSMPYGSLGSENGLLFIAYANNPAKFDRMLDRMVGKDESDSVHGKHNDDIMSFSKCIHSNYYYFPTQEELKKML